MSHSGRTFEQDGAGLKDGRVLKANPESSLNSVCSDEKAVKNGQDIEQILIILGVILKGQ